jgi:hypothetical protein
LYKEEFLSAERKTFDQPGGFQDIQILQAGIGMNPECLAQATARVIGIGKEVWNQFFVW